MFVRLDIDSVVEHLDSSPNLVIHEMVVGFDLVADKAFQMLCVEIGIENDERLFHIRGNMVEYVFSVVRRDFVDFFLDLFFELFDMLAGIAFCFSQFFIDNRFDVSLSLCLLFFVQILLMFDFHFQCTGSFIKFSFGNSHREFISITNGRVVDNREHFLQRFGVRTHL